MGLRGSWTSWIVVGTLAACSADVGTISGGGVVVQPSEVTLAPNGSQAFAVNPPTVTWSIREGTVGGQITQSGLYTAPTAAGTYTIVALETSSGVSGTAYVTVQTGGGGSSTHGLTLPATHPRLWFDASRLARARSWYQSNPFTPSSGDHIGQALRGLLANEASSCRSAITWALDVTRTMQTSGTACDECRWSGEEIILVYDWCYPHLTSSERSTFMSATNNWINAWRTATWGGVGMSTNNYYWGYLRNELLWAMATHEANVTMAERFLDDVFTTRLAQDFNPTTLAELRGGVGVEGSQYGPYPAWYSVAPFVTAGLYGRDLYNETNFWKEAVYAYVYSVSPTRTVTGGLNEFTVFPWSDDEQWRNGNQVSAVKSNFMTAAAMKWGSSAVGQHARQWLALTGGTADRHVRAVDPGGTARAFTDLPLDYYGSGAKYAWGRSSWGASPTTFMLQLGEGPGSGHAHVDWGTWQMWRGGRFLSRESTSYGESIAGFGASGTAGGDQALAHNSLLVNGVGPNRSPWVSGRAVVRRMESRPGYYFAAVDLSGTTTGSSGNANMLHWEREFVFVRGLETMVVLDRVQSSNAGDTKTFVVHCETNPALATRSATCTNGTQALAISTLVPASASYRTVTEGGSIGQYRIEIVTSPGVAQSYILTVLQAKDASAARLNPTVSETTTSYTVQLDASNAITFEKGMVSSGGSITVAGATSSLRSNVQPIVVTDAGPAWQ